MIHYQLRCAADHGFDGWFKDSAAFDQLCARDLVECPHCGSVAVCRALMAPALATRRARPKTIEGNVTQGDPAEGARGGASRGGVPGGGALGDSGADAGEPARHAAEPAVASKAMAPAPTSPGSAVEPRLPDQLRAMLQRMRATVERNCDYVGPDFAQEARRIQQGDVAPRGIYGEATPDEAEALAEDGIEVTRIPWVPRAEG